MNAESYAEMEFKITMTLTEEEARALYQFTGYGTPSFLKAFYENLGTYYLKPHEKGVYSLFDAIGKQLPPHLARIDKARKVFEK